MKYLDSNVFIYPLLYKGKKATKAQNILNEMVLGKAPCITSSLTLDEIIWIIMKMHDRTKAIEIARDSYKSNRNRTRCLVVTQSKNS
jgi:predicted nucleic acid-binding protein